MITELEKMAIRKDKDIWSVEVGPFIHLLHELTHRGTVEEFKAICHMLETFGEGEKIVGCVELLNPFLSTLNFTYRIIDYSFKRNTHALYTLAFVSLEKYQCEMWREMTQAWLIQKTPKAVLEWGRERDSVVFANAREYLTMDEAAKPFDMLLKLPLPLLMAAVHVRTRQYTKLERLQDIEYRQNMTLLGHRK